MVSNVGKEYGMMIPMVRRTWWGAIPAKYSTPLQLPVKYVRLTHTNTPRCTNKMACFESLRDIQKFYVEEIGLPDIPYNFMIGGECLIYKGRGWYTEPDRPPELAWLKGLCIDIAFIGKHEMKMPDERVMQRGFDLITFGIKRNLILPDYKLIPIGENPKFPF